MGPGVLLSEEVLKTISSAELEAHMKQLAESRQLNEDEERVLRKQLRKVKAREYSRRKRQDKKQNIAQLETKLKDLSRKNNLLQSQVLALNSQVATLSSENHRLRQYVTELQANEARKPSWFSSIGGTSRGATAVGACLLGVVFFAFFLGFTQLPTGGGLDGTPGLTFSTSRVILSRSGTVEIPEGDQAAPGNRTPTDTESENRDSSGEECSVGETCYLFKPKPDHLKTQEMHDAPDCNHQTQHHMNSFGVAA